MKDENAKEHAAGDDGMIAIQLLALLPENAILNAISSAWISIGNIWMFSGLLLTMRFADGYKKA